MSIQTILNTAIYSKLTGGTALTALLTTPTSVYFNQLPDQNKDSEYVVFSYQAGGDDNIAPGRLKNNVLNIRAYSKTGSARAGSIDAQIDALLHLTPLTVAGWSNFWLARENDFALVENTEDNEKYQITGGFYRIRLDQN